MIETYIPLYRKYRPQQLSDLVGQEVVSTAISNALALNKIAHAYLFCGPRGTGKTSSARIMAKSLNCAEGPTATPCQTCPSCVTITQGNALDVTEIDAASNNGVDDVRVMMDKVQFAPIEGKFKIYIIDEVHMLSNQAFNALLKTLEEPPAKVVFILATTEPHKVLPTIISRCQRFDFSRITRAQIESRVAYVAQCENIQVSPEAVNLIARHARGGMRDALGLLDQVAVLGRSDSGTPIQPEEVRAFIGVLEEDLLFNLTQGIIEKTPENLLAQIRQLQERGIEPVHLVKELTQHFRNLLIAKACGPNASGDDFEIAPDLYSKLCQQAQGFETEEIPQIMNRLSLLESQLRNSHQPQLWLEVALLDICYRQDILLLKQLSERVAALEGGRPMAPSQAPTAPPQRPAPVQTQPMATAPQAIQPPVTATSEVVAPQPVLTSPPPQPIEAVPAPVPTETVAPAVIESPVVAPSTATPTGSQNLQSLWHSILQTIPVMTTTNLLKDHFFLMEQTETTLIIGYTKSKETLLNTFKMSPAKMGHLEDAIQAMTGRKYRLDFQLTDSPAPIGSAVTTAAAPTAFTAPIPKQQPAPSSDTTVIQEHALTQPEISTLTAQVAPRYEDVAPTAAFPPTAPTEQQDSEATTEPDYEMEQAKHYTQELLQGKVID